MTRVLVLGQTGQLARGLARATAPEGWRLSFTGRDRADLLDPDSVTELIRSERPDVVINTAAYTAVDRAEAEPDLAFAVNARAPEAIAKAALGSGSLLIHVSTDYVYGGGSGGPYSEADPVAPVQAYGRSKAEGERLLLAANPQALVVRTAWLLSEMSGFVRAILERARRGEALRVVDDQMGNPTHADDLAAALLKIAQMRLEGRGEPGILHVAGPLSATWCEVARDLIAPLERENGTDEALRPISSSEYGATAPRPRDSRLSVAQLKSRWGMELRPWTAWVAETAKVGQSSAPISVEKGQQSGG